MYLNTIKIYIVIEDNGNILMQCSIFKWKYNSINVGKLNPNNVCNPFYDPGDRKMDSITNKSKKVPVH